MGILAGILVFIVAQSTSSPIPIGNFWPISLAGFLAIICGAIGKFMYETFTIGVTIAAIAWVVVNFAASEQPSFLLWVQQVVPALSAVFFFAIGSVFSPDQSKNI